MKLVVVLGIGSLVADAVTLTFLVIAGRADRLRAYGRNLTTSSTGSRSGTRCS